MFFGAELGKEVGTLFVRRRDKFIFHMFLQLPHTSTHYISTNKKTFPVLVDYIINLP